MILKIWLIYAGMCLLRSERCTNLKIVQPSMATVTASKVALMGRSIKMMGSPRESSKARRMFSSTMGPKM